MARTRGKPLTNIQKGDKSLSMTVHKELGPANKHMSLVPDPSSSEPQMRPLVEILIVAS